ncbi:MAG: sodium:calcium antiporter, partial [Bacteroidales bacterium]
LTSLVYPLKVVRQSIRMDWPFMMLATLLFTWAASTGLIGRTEGILAFLLLVGYTAWQIYDSRKQHQPEEETVEKPDPIWLAAIFIIGSCLGLAYGADFLIQGASSIAHSFGISERIIGVTIVAFGTSLPELAASLSAAFKKQTDIAIGNIIGSNLFNILSVVGMTAIIRPIPVNWDSFRPDFLWMCGIAFLLLIMVLPLKNLRSITEASFFNRVKSLSEGGKLGRAGGIVFVVIYIFYIYTLLING